jgi:magnesium-transporting ATPase (P-type)
LSTEEETLAYKEQNPKMINLDRLLELLIITVCLVIAVIPEGLQLAVIYCLSQYASIGLYKKGDLIFKKLKTLENMGRLDFLVLEKQGALENINDSYVKKWYIPE